MTIALLNRRGKFYGQPDKTARLGKTYKDRAVFFSLMDGEVYAQDIANGNNLSPQSGTPTSVITPWGKSLYFDRSTSQLRSTRVIPVLPTFTIMAWVRPTGTLNAGYTRILDTAYDTGFYLGSNSGTQYAFIVNNSSLEGCIGGQQVTGQRDFVVGTFDGTNRVLYVNGIQVASASATAPTVPSYLYVGYTPGSYVWEGNIDTVGIFQGALAASTIRETYQDPWRIFEAPKRFIGFSFSAGSSVTLTAAASTQANSSGTGAITLAHNLTGANSTQANASGTGAISQAHALTGATSTQTNLSATGSISQTQVLAGAASSQDNLSSSGAVTVGASVTLTGATSVQANASGAGAITQTHVLSASACTQDGASSAVAITQVQVLTGAGSTQANLGGTGAVSLSTGDLIGAPSTQVNLGGVGQITRTQTLTGDNCIQVNSCSTGAWSTGIVFESALIAGDISPPENLIIKKPGIPTGTPDWEKTMFEILTGRRGNAVPIPIQPALTFSATPTQAECQALFSYVNLIRDAQEKLITRFDS